MFAYSAPKKQNMTKNMQNRLENKQNNIQENAEQGRKMQNMQEMRLFNRQTSWKKYKKI